MGGFTVYINDSVVHEYVPGEDLSAAQLAYLDKMDGDMARGIRIQGELIPLPDLSQRARFVALKLVKALQQDNDAVIAVTCAWLSIRMPLLSELRISDVGEHIEVCFKESA